MTSPLTNSVFLKSGMAATNAEFKLRVSAAIAKVADFVLHEDDATPNHAERRSLALAIAGSPTSFVDRFVWACASNPSISASVSVDPTSGKVAVLCPDDDIEYVIGGIWDVVAGVR